jgi:hypothetical protein
MNGLEIIKPDSDLETIIWEIRLDCRNEIIIKCHVIVSLTNSQNCWIACGISFSF